MVIGLVWKDILWLLYRPEHRRFVQSNERCKPHLAIEDHRLCWGASKELFPQYSVFIKKQNLEKGEQGKQCWETVVRDEECYRDENRDQAPLGNCWVCTEESPKPLPMRKFVEVTTSEISYSEKRYICWSVHSFFRVSDDTGI